MSAASTRRILVGFSVCFMAERYILQQVSEEVNRKLPAMNTTVQLLTLHADPERYHNAQRYRRTGDILTENTV